MNEEMNRHGSNCAGRPSDATERLSVATYNIHRCLGRDGRRDPDRIGEVIREIGADIIGLQELDWRPYAQSKHCRIDEIIRRTGLNAVYGYTLPHNVGRYGNALLTSHRILDVRRMDLSVPGREPRGAIDVDLDIQGKIVQVIVTHLGLRAYERKYQIKRLLDVLTKDPERLTIVLGDFNEWTPVNRRVRRLCTDLGKCPRVKTFPSLYPILPLDRIWVRPVELLTELCVHNTLTSRVASDHLPLKAKVSMAGRVSTALQRRA